MAREAANQASEEAVYFLDDLAVKEPQCESLAFTIFETLIRDTWQKTEAVVKKEVYNSWCHNGRNTMQILLLQLAENLASIRPPFSSSVEQLAERDNDFRNIFAWINHQSCCCNTNLFSDLAHEQDFLRNQLLILLPEERPPALDQTASPEMTSTCEVCFDQDVKRVQLTQECEHEGSVCLACLAQAITAQLDRKHWNELTCPLCPARLCSNTVERYAPEETIRRLVHQQ
ncbi:MAG: hypothetical protein M1812_001809 [Candelaria pacifica]|nr:MAG: hypothetical protein M1812_001809 [Candelaria pacifica]